MSWNFMTRSRRWRWISCSKYRFFYFFNLICELTALCEFYLINTISYLQREDSRLWDFITIKNSKSMRFVMANAKILNIRFDRLRECAIFCISHLLNLCNVCSFHKNKKWVKNTLKFATIRDIRNFNNNCKFVSIAFHRRSLLSCWNWGSFLLSDDVVYAHTKIRCKMTFNS